MNRSAALADRALTLAVIVMTVFAVGAVVSRLRPGPADALARIGIQGPVPEYRSFHARGHASGGSGSGITLVVFSDFLCPFCRSLAHDYDSLQRSGDSDLRVVFRHLPMQVLHPRAREFAQASECAAAEGRFWQFHDLAFDSQDSLQNLTTWSLAARAGVADSVGFAECLRKESIAARVTTDSVAASGLGARGTPTLLVEDILVVGSLGFRVLDSLIHDRQSRRRAENRGK